MNSPSPDRTVGFVSTVDESNAPLSRVPLSKWEKTGDTRTLSRGKMSQKTFRHYEFDSAHPSPFSLSQD